VPTYAEYLTPFSSSHPILLTSLTPHVFPARSS
jgi:hypothetical protein